jgi:drug/metabolite transporter (DMT)-like permease
MTKLMLILLVGLAFEAGGVVLLKKGVGEIGSARTISSREIFGLIKRGVANPKILLGVTFEAIFFGCLLVLMGKSDISFLWPMTALSFVFTTFAGILFLQERVSGIRWFGVVFIVIGAAFISYSEHSKEKTAPPITSLKAE